MWYEWNKLIMIIHMYLHNQNIQLFAIINFKI
jgi:hypothetical protein